MLVVVRSKPAFTPGGRSRSQQQGRHSEVQAVEGKRSTARCRLPSSLLQSVASQLMMLKDRLLVADPPPLPSQCSVCIPEHSLSRWQICLRHLVDSETRQPPPARAKSPRAYRSGHLAAEPGAMDGPCPPGSARRRTFCQISKSAGVQLLLVLPVYFFAIPHRFEALNHSHHAQDTQDPPTCRLLFIIFPHITRP